MAAHSGEGVLHFEAEHETRALEERGYGYGNVSARVGPLGDVGRGQRRFLVTGTQTGGRQGVTLADFCLVERYDLARNRVTSRGLVPPSSESLTHGAIYDIAPTARVV